MMGDLNSKIIGGIHSIQSFGTVDGPGIRTVVFFQGCPLRCKFCHNIDCATGKLDEATYEFTPRGLAQKVLQNREYWSNGRGGVTCSGGEPTYQPEFLYEFVKLLHEEGVHVAIDSCSLTSERLLKKLLPYVDLWMLSFKHIDPVVHKELTGVGNKLIKRNILKLDEMITEEKNDLQKRSDGDNSTDKMIDKKIRIRFLVIPGITDTTQHIKELSEYLRRIKNFEGIEVLGYGKHGKFKWEKLFGGYEFDHVPEATPTDVQNVKEQFSNFEIKLI